VIFVDEIFNYAPAQIAPAARMHGVLWCHMWTDRDVEELHRFAIEIGLKREYFQQCRICPHYDLTPGMRQIALAHGAKEKNFKDYIREKFYPMQGPRKNELTASNVGSMQAVQETMQS
jgi:hypothetical protein